jgi:anti-sigma regulatory factor (Ser/Thr protein kinase)
MAAVFAASYEASPSTIGLLRNQVAGLARQCGLNERAVGDVKLAVSEAATNAYVHGYRSGEGTIRVEADVGDGELRIRVCDHGLGMRPRTDSPGLGLGLPVIASLAQRVEILEDQPGTEVHMAFACPAHPRPREDPPGA